MPYDDDIYTQSEREIRDAFEEDRRQDDEAHDE